MVPAGPVGLAPTLSLVEKRRATLTLSSPMYAPGAMYSPSLACHYSLVQQPVVAFGLHAGPRRAVRHHQKGIRSSDAVGTSIIAYRLHVVNNLHENAHPLNVCADRSGWASITRCSGRQNLLHVFSVA